MSWTGTLEAARSTFLLVFVILAAAPGAARAQSAADEQARSLFEAGRTAYESGNFEDALRYFEEAYRLSQRPALLYNIGQAADRLDRNARALEAYRGYVAQVPDAPNLDFVRGRIQVLEASPTAPAGQAEASPAPWVIAGIGAAMVGAGVAMVVVAGNDANAVNTAPDGSVWADYAGAADGAVPISIAGQVLTYVGAAAIAGGVVWGIVDLLGSGGGGETVALRVGPGSIALLGRFE